jgi:hypothetical protein
MNDPETGAVQTHSTLVQYLELWNVDADGQSLTLQNQTRFRGQLVDSGTPERTIRVGEGLAGMALNQRRAIILQESPSELLQRIGAKNGLELTALIGYPIMKGHEVISVVVFGICAGPGAFEIWSRDDRDELSISASYYSGLKSFEFISRHVKFPKGAGLPGGVWKSGQPRLASDLGHNPRFMRSFAADETQLNTGLGLPVGSSAGNSDSVLMLLSSHSKPIVAGIEIWQPEASSASGPDMPRLTRTALDWCAFGISSPTTDGVIAETWKAGRPILLAEACSGLGSLRAAGPEHSVRALLAIPVYRGPEKAAVVLLGF